MLNRVFAHLIGGTPAPSMPAEWAGINPWLDWDPDNATSAGSLVATMPDSSGNGRDGAQTSGGSYPFSVCPMPELVSAGADTLFNGHATLKFAGNPNVDAVAPALLLPSLPAGPITIAIVGQTDMPDHGLMPGGGGAGSFTNNYALSAQGDVLGIYADGAATRAFGGWLDSGFGEPARGADFASSPHVMIFRSSGETSPGANDSVTSLFANSQTPSTLGSRAPFAGGPALLGSYQGGMIYVLQGKVARLIIWNSSLTNPQVLTSLGALGVKHAITIAP